ncbi:hypothetical protein VF09_37005 [Nostoc linckia z9]|nr:hypothetical protein VF09_37005 [Nostoc linckia z9]
MRLCTGFRPIADSSDALRTEGWAGTAVRDLADLSQHSLALLGDRPGKPATGNQTPHEQHHQVFIGRGLDGAIQQAAQQCDLVRVELHENSRRDTTQGESASLFSTRAVPGACLVHYTAAKAVLMPLWT